MELHLTSFIERPDFTIGRMTVNGAFICYTLEDEYRDEKVHGETRIPEGRYRVVLRREGGFHQRYLKKFGKPWHQGMLHVLDVPGFDYILIHIGNSDEDTAGCVLVGKTFNETAGFLGSSEVAYKELYPHVRQALLDDEPVWLIVQRSPKVNQVRSAMIPML